MLWFAIFDRGTTEPAPIGVVAGPPLEAALKTAFGSKTFPFAGVDYPASIPGFLEGGDPQGSATMASDLTNAANSFPNAAIVTVGYSQGGNSSTIRPSRFLPPSPPVSTRLLFSWAAYAYPHSTN
ncbi:cutinase-domain-containing protein [Mycena maculata]|uniref:cutinase n=1 Tax=Mycena maculata TaxID=230809 RepID=A0AAD7NQT2_9AGAR|nr:cutinase-domain-containing protein [Mycena maculata]